jgi:hypothetical protein
MLLHQQILLQHSKHPPQRPHVFADKAQRVKWIADEDTRRYVVERRER